MLANEKNKTRLIFRINLLIVVSCTLISTSGIAANTIFTCRSAESSKDHRYDYDNEIFELALKKTTNEFGSYSLEKSPAMNFARALDFSKRNLLQNFFFKQSYSQQLAKDLAYIPFPVDLGIVGYRVCFISKKIKQKILSIKSLDDIKKFSMGQGTGWGDVDILRFNGFKVVEVHSYESLFDMVAENRFDMFCRGTNELHDEFQSHKHIKNLTYDTSISLSYPLPRFFFTNSKNKEGIKRVLLGLTRAYEDGSLLKVWLKYYKKSVDFVKLHKRKIFKLENPYLEGLSLDFNQYSFNPLKITQ